MHPFVRGESYDREDVLRFLGSRQNQSGIVFGSNPSLMALFTGGRFAKRAGYKDGGGSDGVFLYCGQGSRGDQRLAGANKVLTEHQGEVLLFEIWKPRNSWKGRQRFLGEYRVLGYEWTPGSSSRKGDRLLVFSLVPFESMPNDGQLPVAATTGDDIAVLRAEAVAAGRLNAPVYATKSEYRARSLSVARYVLARANGICEACKKPAPFKRVDGTPYLEVHHTRRLADEGPDDIVHVAGICPNYHREAHFGPDIDGLRANLEKLVAEKEGTRH
jgi:5-methylcytosine-specific restriction protein A